MLDRVVMVSILGIASYGCAQNSTEKLTVVSLCQLLDNVEKYHRQIVAVQGIISVGFESRVMSDPLCKEKGPTDIEWSKSLKKAPPALGRLFGKDHRALVVLEGTFYGPEPVQVDPSLPGWMKEKLKDAKRRYGHMDMYETMLEVTAIREVRRVPPKTP